MVKHVSSSLVVRQSYVASLKPAKGQQPRRDRVLRVYFLGWVTCCRTETRISWRTLETRASDCEFILMFAASDGNDQGEKVLSNGDDLLDQSQTVRLLGKDLPAEARSIRLPSSGKRNSVTEADRPSSHVMKVFSGMNDRTQPPSLLERGLLPGFRRGANISGSPTPSQLTIFYAGAVHVYDNVPFDKAQAIMLLAGESSSSKHGLFPQLQETKGITHLPQPVLPSVCKLEAG